ncbi:integrase, catalytic region, zinc finger, CCHC-type containing protein [Tanacetum coccineum]
MATVRNVRTDNGTEFVNQTLREWYENVGITHQTSVARTPQQNGSGKVSESKSRHWDFRSVTHLQRSFTKSTTRRTQINYKTIHVTFAELTAMASEQFSSGPDLQGMTAATSSTGLGSNPVSQQPCM